jgi:esterase/lipase superfamily enzyme
VSYFQVKAAVPESARDLAPFVEALAAQGIEKMHFMIHSMGARVLLAAWPQLTRVFRRLRAFDRERCELRERSSPTANQPSPGARSPVLGTLTLVNADVPRAQALEVLPEMVEFAERVTFYSDAHDVALWGSSLLSGEPVLGRFPEPISCSHNLQEYGAECIDVIDCTSMEQNVHAVRHCYYCFNVQILEDLVDLIQSGAPARLRTARLVSKGIGNVFSFLCPPAFLRE